MIVENINYLHCLTSIDSYTTIAGAFVGGVVVVVVGAFVGAGVVAAPAAEDAAVGAFVGAFVGATVVGPVPAGAGVVGPVPEGALVVGPVPAGAAVVGTVPAGAVVTGVAVGVISSLLSLLELLLGVRRKSENAESDLSDLELSARPLCVRVLAGRLRMLLLYMRSLSASATTTL